MKRKFYLYLFILFAFSANSQEIGENNLGAWYMYSGTFRVSDKLCVSSASELWNYEPTNNFHLFLVLTGLRYDFNSNISATVGYAYANIDSSYENLPDETLIRENRIYEQISLKNNNKKFRINHRCRLEQRFFNYGDRNKLKHRMRYRLKMTIPLTKTFFINVFDEIIINLQNEIFNQNRIYGALGVCITPSSKLQLGYLKFQLSDASYDRLQIGISINTDFRKKKAKQHTANNFTNKENVSIAD